jgi:hypothetical protein
LAAAASSWANAVAMKAAARRLRAGQVPNLQLHQPPGAEADHLAQQIDIAGLLQHGTEIHVVVGHRWVLWSALKGRNQTLPKIRDDRRHCG